MKKQHIEKVVARQIIDSRGNPTVEAEVTLADGTRARASVPSGASTGRYEALELRDGEKNRFGGKGVSLAVSNVNNIIDRALHGTDATCIYTVDAIMKETDGTQDKSNLGANSILSVSMATCRAAAKSLGLSLFQFLGGVNANKMPVPMMNILNGGVHASNNLDVQEFMIMPVGFQCFTEGLRACTEVYHELKAILNKQGLATAVGDEGGFAPNLESDEVAIQFILEAINKAGYQAGEDFVLALDAAASEWKGKKIGEYVLPKTGKHYNSQELIAHWTKICATYPIQSIEDALDEEDWDGWQQLTSELGDTTQLVGDDLFVTNTTRLKKGIETGCANSILIKLNQIGTVTEAMDAVNLANSAGYSSIVSHRSGETEDTFIADLAVALNSGQIKTGAPCRGERVAKYNRLLRIEEFLGEGARYPGITALNIFE
ncbi:MAG: phosphopyruvate hydratase [Spirochaetaceae bacterium]|nr:phosphopyruvate hydratase [Spirochaetaceae bacterium]